MTRLSIAKAWRARDPEKSRLYFQDAAQLIQHAESYFAKVDREPWYRTELVTYKGGYEEVNIPIGRPYSIDGFCAYLGVSDAYFRTAKTQIKERIDDGKGSEIDREVYEAILLIETFIFNQQFEGAAVNVFNAGIISRKQQLAENINATGETAIRIAVRDQQTANNLDDLSTLL